MKFTTCSIMLRIEPSFEDTQIISYVQSYDGEIVHHEIRIFMETNLIAPRRHDLQLLWERDLSEKEAKRITTELKRFTIKGSPQGYHNVLDGTTYQLKITEGINSIEVKWWSHLPNEWKSVWELVRELQYSARFKTKPKWWQVWR